MKAFMDQDFLLETETAKHLFHDYAEALPLVDYHCHLSPKEIYEDRRFEDLCQVWLGGQQPDGSYYGDHYKWRIMRANGVDESYITGSRPGFARFMKFVEALELSIGNPMYHWCHLELQKFFGVYEPLTAESAERIWEHCNKMLREDPDMTARGLIRKSNVAFIGTTDDPVDTLEYHEKLVADDTFQTAIAPSFRPDKAINLHKPGFTDYMQKLAAAVGKAQLNTVEEVIDALLQRAAFFAAHGCRASDHGLDYIPYTPCTMEQAQLAYEKALAGQPLTAEETDGYQTVILLALGKVYHRLNIAMQLHYSCLRNTNTRMYQRLGLDTGLDVIAQNTCGGNIAKLLNDLDSTDQCPKTILYSLNPADNAQLCSIIGAFQSAMMPGKLQHGSAWWFNDNKTGMLDQMITLGNVGVLGNFIGMLTDSRSFLSYPRHDYFRRILCNLIGTWVENGEYPNNETALKRLIEGISYRNAARYFNLQDVN